jgi:hypothetical protein
VFWSKKSKEKSVSQIPSILYFLLMGQYPILGFKIFIKELVKSVLVTMSFYLFTKLNKKN